jgi:DNA repair protein RecN (Recombination protein N)
MLERLYIKQFAIIDELAIDFEAPFTVLTGETGAGKSIIIEAVAILLGGRAQSEMIRYGAERAYIEGVFSLPQDHEVMRYLLQEHFAELAEDPLILSREFSTDRRNACRINGRTVTLSQYKQVALGLVDIHGQHDYQQLMQSQKQLGILDAYGGRELLDLRTEVGKVYGQWQALERKIKEAQEKQNALLAQKDFLKFQLDEIDQAKLQPDEDDALNSEIRRLSHSDRIMKNLQKAYEQMFGASDAPSAYDMLGKALNYLRDLGKYDPELTELYDSLEPASYIMDEAARRISNYQDQLDVSPKRLEDAENRLYRIKSLCKKYGDTVLNVLEHRERVAAELQTLENWEDQEKSRESERKELSQDYFNLARKLHDLRCETGARLEASVDAELKDLAMESARFQTNIQPAAPGATGTDSAEFLISSNAGEAFLPLAKIASGGELSRIILAMKRILASMDSSDTMIFDEIDSGIGGKTVHAVADKLWTISRNQQVICVTHAAAIAAKANQHLLLVKEEAGGRTQTGVKVLSSQDRISELARMLGGDSQSPELLAHAQSLLKRSHSDS